MSYGSRSGLAFTAAALVTLVLAVSHAGAALEQCRLLRQPDIAGERIVFVYGGDLWTVPRGGGVAARLTTHEGIERFPKFSPDGETVAFTAQYDGNLDAFVVPVLGGEPKRLTWHPSPDQVAEWYPDGSSILLRSDRAVPIQRFQHYYRVPAEGGFEERLPLPEAGYASLSADGSQIAFVSPSYDNRSWKRYRGGNAPEIWVYDFRKNTSEKITDWDGPDEWPMWHGRTVYYASDRGGWNVNLWAWDADRKSHRQVTHYTDDDVKWPSIGGDSIVFEKGGELWVLDLSSERVSRIDVLVPSDRPGTRAELRNVAALAGATGWALSPSAKRAVIDARGEIFTVPTEKGDARNLTQSPGTRERDPAWSPDGKWIAYLSDASGEYEIHVAGSDGATPDRQVTRGGTTFRFAPRWSPDSKKLAFSDKTMSLWWTDVATGKLTKVDESEDGEIRDYQWSSDSRWIVYPKPRETGFSQLHLYSLDAGKVTSLTDGFSDDFSPTFDPEGKYLFFLSRRTLDPEFGNFELNMQFSATDRIYATTLRRDLASPVTPLSDEETGQEPDKGSEDKEDGDEAKDDKDEKKGDEDKNDKGKDEKEAPPEPVKIDIEGLAARTVVLPVPPGRLAGLTAFKGKLLYLTLDPYIFGGGGPPTNATLHVFDLEKREDKTVLSKIQAGYSPSKDGGKVLYRTADAFAVVETVEGKTAGDGKIPADTLLAVVDPRREWMQMFDEAWRLERDFYYDPGMSGLDWKAIGDGYRKLVPYVADRADLNYILGDMIGELATSHAYVGGGDAPQVAPAAPTGLLGADWQLDGKSGFYRFAKIYRESDWNTSEAAPLGAPGVEVREGDYLLDVDGASVKAPSNLYAAFEGKAGKQVKIRVGSSPNDAKARTYAVVPVSDDRPLRYVDWVASNRAKVAEATGGRVAYIHVPDTAIGGMREFTRQFYPQVDKEGIIVDERWNGGGFIPDFFIERLQRTTWVRWSSREGNGFKTPGSALDGPRCILINQYAGSGGDAFPHYFRMRGLGPLIGKRTWGGLVGISHSLPLVDGGEVTMPDFGMWDPATGEWVVENRGVEPDIDVENRPEEVVAGGDPQLERAIRYMTDELAKRPTKKRLLRPPYKVQER